MVTDRIIRLVRRGLALLVILGLTLAQAGALAQACTCQNTCAKQCCPTDEHKPCKASLDAADEPIALFAVPGLDQFPWVLPVEAILFQVALVGAGGQVQRKDPPRIRAPESGGHPLRAPPHLA